jgi:hypothetical protein
MLSVKVTKIMRTYAEEVGGKHKTITGQLA